MSSSMEQRAPALAALFERYRPGTSIDALAQEMGVPASRFYYLFRKERTPDLPKWEILTLVAGVLKCSVTEVVTAMAKDAGRPLDLESEQSAEEGELLKVFRQMARRDRRLFLTIGRTIAEEQ